MFPLSFRRTVCWLVVCSGAQEGRMTNCTLVMNTYAQKYNLQLELPSFGTVISTRTLQKPVFSTSSSSSSHIDNQRDLSNQVLGRKNDHFEIINNLGLSRWMADEAIGNPNKVTVSSIDWWASFEQSMFIAGKYI